MNQDLPPRPGSEYQRLVAEIASAFDPQSEIVEGQWVVGPDGRLDMDVAIHGKEEGQPFLAVIECKDYELRRSGKVKRAVVDALDSKRFDLRAKYAVICSNSGFTRDATAKATRKGIGLITILRSGDERVKVVVTEEVFFRKIDLGPVTFRYTGVGFDPGEPQHTHQLRFQGRSIDSWLWLKASLVASRQWEEAAPINLEFRLARPVPFELHGGTVVVEKLGVACEPKLTWYNQSVEIDATGAIYDYIRRRVRLEPGSQDYFMRDVDFDRGRKVSKAPPHPSARERLRPGEVEIDLVAIDGGPPEDEPAPPSFDHLIVPEDLQLG